MKRKVLILTGDSMVSLRQTINGKGFSDDDKYEFFINDIDGKPDFVVVKGKGISSDRLVDVPKERTMLVTCEPYGIIGYPRGYCEQFGTVLACQPQLCVSPASGTTVVNTPAVLPWYAGAVFKNGNGVPTMNREDLQAAAPEKKKFMSVITTKKAFTKGHVDRLRFIKKLKEYYGDKVDIYGYGFKSFEDKWEVIAPYKYHIVIENSTCDFYWTEKLADCYLGGAYPLYHGCANISDYFPQGSYTAVDIRDFDNFVKTVERVEKERVFENSASGLAVGKQLVLGKYNMFNLIATAFDAIEDTAAQGETLLKPSSAFFSWHNLYLHLIEWGYYRFLAKYFV